MTTSSESTLRLEDVPLKKDFRLQRESLPKNIEKTFSEMKIGQSFFLATEDDDHTTRKISALRSRAIRYQDNNPTFAFSIRREINNDERGVRFYRIEDNEDNQ